MDHQQLFLEALKNEEPFQTLSETVKRLRVQGIEKSTLLEQLESLRSVVDTEENEDIVLDVMDYLVGYCAPHIRID